MLGLFTLRLTSISHDLALLHPWSYARALFYNSFCTPVHELFVTLHSVHRCPFQNLWFPLACLSSCSFSIFFLTGIPYALKMEGYVPPTSLHGAITQKTTILIFTAMKTSNHMYMYGKLFVLIHKVFCLLCCPGIELYPLTFVTSKSIE